MKLTARVYESIDEVPEDAWDAAVAASDAAIFYSRAYLRAYERSRLHGAKQHLYVVVSDLGSADHAVLPMVEPAESDPLDVVSRAFPEIDLASTCLVSAGWHCYEGQLPATSARLDLVKAMVATVREVMRERSIEWFALANVDETNALRPQLERLGLRGDEADERFVMDLEPFADFDAYVASLSRRIRQDTRRYARRAAEAGLQTDWKTPEEADLGEVLRVVHLTAARYGVETFYPSGPFQAFVRLLGDSALVVESRLGEEMIGAGICMIDANRFHQWAFGVDYTKSSVFSPYGIVFEQTFRAALASGSSVLEGGRRNGLYKARRGLSRRRLYTYLLRGAG
jgi:predicted N-acyltransferase